MIVAGYLGALVMGLLLGLLGGGGSILTVPILVYLFHTDTVLATAYSLFIVGTTALFGCAHHIRIGNVDRRDVLLFGLPSIIAVVITRRYLVNALPDPLIERGSFVLSRSEGLLVFFAILMLLAARHMLRKTDLERASAEHVRRVNEPMLAVRGALTGMVTSLVGAGGGFLIVPALVVFAKLPMNKAVGTSLLIIAANGLIGAAFDPRMQHDVDWRFLLMFTSIAVAGTLAGSAIGACVPHEKLKPAFGWFVLVMGAFIMLKELVIT